MRSSSQELVERTATMPSQERERGEIWVGGEQKRKSLSEESWRKATGKPLPLEQARAASQLPFPPKVSKLLRSGLHELDAQEHRFPKGTNDQKSCSGQNAGIIQRYRSSTSKKGEASKAIKMSGIYLILIWPSSWCRQRNGAFVNRNQVTDEPPTIIIRGK